MDLTQEERVQYAAIIDGILAVSDLSVVSEKKIRKGLEEKLGRDLTDLKHVVKPLILERFDRFSAATAAAPASPGATPEVQSNSHVKTEKRSPSESASQDDYSELEDQTPPKKKRKHEPDTDEMIARRLQEQENRGSRPTRGSATKKAPVRKQASKPKKKKVKTDDDGEEVVRKGGFHKEYLLSQELTDLTNETQLSRPQVVKRIWDYIKEHELQDPNDKRQIICDDKLTAVFKQDKVHMFTMNKLLGKSLYPIEEAQAS